MRGAQLCIIDFVYSARLQLEYYSVCNSGSTGCMCLLSPGRDPCLHSGVNYSLYDLHMTLSITHALHTDQSACMVCKQSRSPLPAMLTMQHALTSMVQVFMSIYHLQCTPLCQTAFKFDLSEVCSCSSWQGRREAQTNAS